MAARRCALSRRGSSTARWSRTGPEASLGTFLLLDGHSLAYRAWFALAETQMATASGQETAAVYGFITMTTRLLNDHHPQGMAVAFDLRAPTFRDEIAVDYKAGRTAAPDTFHAQVELVRQF